MDQLRRRSGRRWPAGHAALIALVGALLWAGCGGADDGSQRLSEPGPFAESRVGSVAPFAQCRDWSAGSVEERFATIEDIGQQLSSEGAAADSPPIPDDEAYEVLERACANEFAAGFRLYKLYARAAAFRDIAE